MSHQPERTEKDCLNCGVIVKGRFCQNCGQENSITKQSAGALIKHFIYDIFHFDGKFFDTLKPLFVKPGLVPAAFIQGKRLTYLDPVRMYLFTSAFFFIIFFSLKKGDFQGSDFGNRLTSSERAAIAMEVNARLQRGDADSLRLTSQLNTLLDSTRVISIDDLKPKDTASELLFRGKAYSIKSKVDSTTWEDQEKYARANWFQRKMMDRVSAVRKKFANEKEQGLASLLEKFVRRAPYILFVSLPFFALILKLLYLRRKQFYYSDHLVFTLYHYIFSFLLLLLLFGVGGMDSWLDWAIFDWILFILVAAGAFYLYKGMRLFYGQGRGKTLAKFFLLNVLGLASLLFLLFLFLLVTAFQL